MDNDFLNGVAKFEHKTSLSNAMLTTSGEKLKFMFVERGFELMYQVEFFSP